MVPNAPRGLSWPKGATVYHATGAMRAILDHGFRTREQLGGRHVTGGGPDNSISFTLDKRTARAIVLGLRTIRGITRGEILLGDLIIQAAEVAPKALAQTMENLKVDAHVRSPEDVERVDRGLEWFTSRYATLKKTQIEQILASGQVEELVDHGYGVVEGWAPSEVLARAQPERWGPITAESWQETAGMPPSEVQSRVRQEWRYHRHTYEAYRKLLSFGSWDHEVYDPVFFMTDIGPLSRLSDDDLGIVSAKIAADWVCMEYDAAQQLGYEPGAMTEPRMWSSTMSDWTHGCEQTLRHSRDPGEPYHSTLPRGWDPPTRQDTIVYHRAMAELRVYDTALIHDVREVENLDDVLNEARDAWDRKKHVVDDPFWMPYHRDEANYDFQQRVWSLRR